MKRLTLSGYLLFFLLSNGFAQESEVELNPVTVTASINPTTVSQTGRNLVVLQGEQFRHLPVHSVDELLRYIPGIEVQARGPMGTQSDFSLRGGTFQQVLVIVDGLRMNDPNTGHFSSYIPIAPSEIERIEVLKGASSAIYGSDAVGGVINIITKAFAARQNAQPQKNAQLQLLGGQYGLLTANAGAFYTNGKTSVAGGVLSNNADGQPQRGTSGFFHLHTASLSLNHQINNHWKVGVRSALDARTFAAQNYYTTSVADTADEKVQTLWNQLQVAYQKGNNKLSLTTGYKAVEDLFRFNSVSVANDNRSNLYQALAVYEHGFGEKTSLTTGTQFQNRSIHSNDRGNHEVKQAAAFALLQQTIGTSLNVTPALRLDWDERSGTELVPQLNLSYRIAAFQLRGSAGKTIRQADFTERYNNYNKAFVPSLNRVGNPDLKAEHSFSYEAGVDLFAAKWVKVSATYFQRNYDDLIDYASTPYSDMPRQSNLSPTGTYFLAKNIANVVTTGVETDIQVVKKLAHDQQIFATAGLVWIHSESDHTTPSLYISSHARFLTNFTVQYRVPWGAVSVNGLYKDRSTQQAAAIKASLSKDYVVVNSKAEAYVWKRKLSVVAQVDNIFDRSYSDLLGAQMPGRWWMGGLKFTL